MYLAKIIEKRICMQIIVTLAYYIATNVSCWYNHNNYCDCTQSQQAANENEVEEARNYFYWAMQGLSFVLIWLFGMICIAVFTTAVLCLIIYLA